MERWIIIIIWNFMPNFFKYDSWIVYGILR